MRNNNSTNNKFAVYPMEIGLMKIEYDGDVIVGLKKIESTKNYGEKTPITDKVFNQLSQYFKGERKTFDLKYELRGTEFQKKVWKALLDIPYGETRAYKEVAVAIGNEKACRAVGNANNKNPISIIVPCHRVIGKNGKLVGYAGGLDMKSKLLELEKENTK